MSKPDVIRYLFVLVLASVQHFAIGQIESYELSGQIVNSNTQHGLEYVTIAVKDKSTDTLIAGTTTDPTGYFRVFVASKNIAVEISFIGFIPIRLDSIDFENRTAELGIIALSPDAQALDEVIVTAEKSTTEFKLDKRIFNVGEDLSSTGASALEVLNNVPSVNVNIEGQISLRGSTGVQILIDGKPSILTDGANNALGTITADMIDKVEVITNPSAKYEAEGTAGIINIVLKKNEKTGLNGSVSVNTGIPDNHSFGLSLNRRTEKFNLFTQLGAGYRELPRDKENINRDKINQTELQSEGEEFRNELFYNIILGTDYYLDPLNVITLSGSFAYEIEDQPSETDFTSLREDIVEGEWTRIEITEADNPKLQYELQFKREFTDDEDHQLLFSAIGRYFGKEQASQFGHVLTKGNVTLNDQITETEFEEGKYTFNIDYTKPINDKWTIEAGGQYLLNDVNNDFTVIDVIDGEIVVDDGLTNEFQYDQKVLGLYSTGSYEGTTWGIKLGMRVENTDLSTLLVNTNEVNQQQFTNLFPSLHTSYKLTDAVSFQAGYSRRIYRPRLWDLNPFFNIRNNFNIRAGNPQLLPEFTDSYELGSIFVYDNFSFNFNFYHRYTQDKIERVSTFVDNINTYRPENIGTNRATGLELNFKITPSKKLTFNGDANYNVFQRDGRFDDQVFDFSADKWLGKLMTKYKMNKAFEIELTTQYESREQTIQGVLADNAYADLGMRYKIRNGQGVFNFSVRDIFASRIRRDTIDQDDFYILARSLRGRFITFGFSYGFGKGEAMQYSGRRR